MELKELISLFKITLNSTNDVVLDGDTEFKELDEWTSLTAFTLVEELSNKYDIRVRGIELRRCNTINDLLNLLNSK